MVLEVDRIDRINFEKHDCCCFVRRLAAAAGVDASPVFGLRVSTDHQSQNSGRTLRVFLIDQGLAEEWDLVTRVLRRHGCPSWSMGRSRCQPGNRPVSDESPRNTLDCKR